MVIEKDYAIISVHQFTKFIVSKSEIRLETDNDMGVIHRSFYLTKSGRWIDGLHDLERYMFNSRRYAIQVLKKLEGNVKFKDY